MIKLLYRLILMSALYNLLACKKIVQIRAPKDEMVTAKVFQNEETAIAALRGIYATMIYVSSFANGGESSVTFLAGRSADDFINQSSNDSYIQFSNNSLLPTNSAILSSLWKQMYQYIYMANAIIEGLSKSTGISKETINQLNGEAKFIRAFCHFYLCNLFGPVPIVTTTDYRVNNVAERSGIEAVYTQIITDLTTAKNELTEAYPASERVRVNRYVVSAFLARVYLYNDQWEKAEKEATEVISNTGTYDLVDVDAVFLKTSKEAILQLKGTYFPWNTYEGSLFILTAAPSSSTQVTLSQDLVLAFESEDLRLKKWVGTFSTASASWNFPYKYKIKTGNDPFNEYSMMLRLAEQYLIRAEARIRQTGKKELGIADLNAIRKRARPAATPQVPNPLPDYVSTMSAPDALLAVEKERRLELFSEWGHRWFDLKRTGRADAVLGPVKGANWQSTDVLYPMPEKERFNNSKLWQNDGYN